MENFGRDAADHTVSMEDDHCTWRSPTRERAQNNGSHRNYCGLNWGSIIIPCLYSRTGNTIQKTDLPLLSQIWETVFETFLKERKNNEILKYTNFVLWVAFLALCRTLALLIKSKIKVYHFLFLFSEFVSPVQVYHIWRWGHEMEFKIHTRKKREK